MVSNNLLNELKEILEARTGRKYNDAEVEEAARSYVGYFELSQKISKRPEFELEEIKKGIYIWKKVKMQY